MSDDTGLIEPPREESAEDAAAITEGDGQPPALSSFSAESSLRELERLEAAGDFKRCAEARAALGAASGEMSPAQRERLDALDARHRSDPLARRMFWVTAMVLVMVALRLWVM